MKVTSEFNPMLRSGQSAEMYAPHRGPLGEAAESLPVVYYVVPALAGLILVIIIIVIVAYIRRKRLKRDRDHRILGYVRRLPSC